MGLRNPADYRSLFWVAIAMTLVAVQYSDPSWVVYLSPISCYMAIAIGTITHNHSHRQMFHSPLANQVFGQVLTFFYGYPQLMWVPTHNLNHHHFVNKPGDATATWRFTNKHNLLVVLTYPFVSGYFQSIPIRDYVERVKAKKPSLYGRIRLQYVLWLGLYIAAGILAAVMYHRQQTGLGVYLWFFAVLLPAIMSSTVIMFFNFIQHVHTDAFSDHDHSRNFVGSAFNFLFFNNGYHTAHHENPALHWSDLHAEHDRISGSIDPKLNEKNLIWFMVRQYMLAPIFPSLGTTQIGTVACDVEPELAVDPVMDVDVNNSVTEPEFVPASGTEKSSSMNSY